MLVPSGVPHGVTTDDSKVVIDHLVKLSWGESGELLAGKLDTARIGAFGHSSGGATAGKLCLDDPRVTAGINGDCHQFGFTLYDTLRTPFLFMYADDSIGVNDPVIRRAAAQVYSMAIHSARHFDCDVRELQAMVHDGILRCTADTLHASILAALLPDGGASRYPADPSAQPATIFYTGDFPTLDEVRSHFVREALERAGGNQSVAARMPGVSQSSLSRWGRGGDDEGG